MPSSNLSNAGGNTSYNPFDSGEEGVISGDGEVVEGGQVVAEMSPMTVMMSSEEQLKANYAKYYSGNGEDGLVAE